MVQAYIVCRTIRTTSAVRDGPKRRRDAQMENRNRESFPDDASWIAYQQIEARIAAEETRKRVEASHKPKLQKRGERSQKAWANIRSQQWRARFRERDPEGYAAY